MKYLSYILLLLSTVAYSQQEIEISTKDITHFWEAYDSLPYSTDSVVMFQRVYINRATDGFKAFIKARDFTALEYVRLIKRYPKFWASIRKNTERIASRKDEIEEVFAKFRSLYPNFKTPKVCFAIGGLRTGGTTTKDLILIGSEIASADSTTDKSEFRGWLSYVLGNTGDIVSMVAHEAVHTQQPINAAYVKGYINHRLLSQCLREGSAEFIGTLLIGEIINKTQYKYGVEHEVELWDEFQAQMNYNDISNWLYNGNLSTTRPANLGYFMGLRIAESYYKNAADKAKAVKEIIEMRSHKKFLKRSKYMSK